MESAPKKGQVPFSSDPVLALGAVTDEFSPTDLDAALGAMADLRMTFADLRVVFGRNIVDLTDAEVDRARAAVEAHGMRVLTITSPLLKCVLPDAPPVDPRVQQDSFASTHTFADQPSLTKRAFEIAERTGARTIRVFSYWRTVDPASCFDRVVSTLRDLSEQAGDRGMRIGLENEHACNIATGAETARLLAAVDHPALGVIWDPANAYVAGETAYPEGYKKLRPSSIVEVHVKDCRVSSPYKPVWGPLGEMAIDWNGQMEALVRDGYRGPIALETHWGGPGGDKMKGSVICGRTLVALVHRAGKKPESRNESQMGMLDFETLHHVAVAVTDLARAKRFYGDVLGLTEIPRPAFSFAGAWYRVGDRDLHLIVVKTPALNAGRELDMADAHLALRVKSFRAARALLESKNVPMRVTIDGPTGFPQIHMMDPDRNIIEINAAELDG